MFVLLVFDRLVIVMKRFIFIVRRNSFVAQLLLLSVQMITQVFIKVKP